MKRFSALGLILLISLMALCICGLRGAGGSGSVAQDCTITVSPGSSIQEAVDAAQADAVVCLAPGIWEENIVIKRGLTLRGVGPGKSVIKRVDWYKPVILIANEVEIKVTIEGLTITGFASITLAGSAQARIINSTVSQIELSDLSWAEIASATVEDGISLSHSAQAKIADSTISGGAGITLADSAQVWVINSTVSEIRLSGLSGAEIASSAVEDGIELSDSAHAKITDSTISKNREYSITLADSAQARIINSTISNIELSDLSWAEIASSTIEDGIELLDSARSKIADSRISGGFGIKLSGSTQVGIINSAVSEIGLSDLSGLEIASSTVENGIRLLNSAQAKITDSTISKNGWGGIKLSDSAQARIMNSTVSQIELSGLGWAEIADSTIETSIGDGIRLSDSAQIEVTTSIIKKSGKKGGKREIDIGDGIKLLGSAQAKIADSTISNWSSYGIKLSDSARVEVTGSTISENTFGIGLSGSAQADIANSVISKNEFSISLGDSAQARITNSRIFENFIITVDGRQAGGISLSNSAWAEITNSTISKNGSGIDLSDQAQAKITNSTISENRFGINLYGSAQAEITTSTISENEITGIVLFQSARAKITNSTISGNGQEGIGLLHSAQAVISNSIISKNRGNGISLSVSTQLEISNSTLSENWGDGIGLWGSAQVAIIENEISNNRSYGVVIADCYKMGFIFTGRVSGRGNKIHNNAKGDVCPNELQFLMTEGAQPANQSPLASFSFTPVSPQAGDEVTFDASASHDPDGSITSYRWDFGDGVEGAGEIVKHVFAQEGTYTVTLTVTDNSGLSKSLSKEVTVSKAAAGPESHSQLGQALHVTFLKVYYGETDFGEQLILHLAIKNMSQETQYLFGAPGGVPQGNTMYVQDSEGRVYYPRSLLGFAFQIVPGQTVENEFPFPVPKAATGLKLYIRTSAGWESFPIPLGVPSSRRLRLRVMEGRYTEIAAPLYSRMDLSKQEWKVGVINKRDMWYLVRYYKKNPGEGNWEEFGTRATEVIKHRNLLWPYGQNRQSIVLNEGDLVKIEISNEAGRDPVLTGIIIVDFFSRALLGSPWAWEDENMVQFLAKVTDKINKVYGVVAHAIAEGPKGVVARIVELLKEEAFRLGVIEVLAKTLKIPQQQLAQKLGGAPTFALSALSNISYWWSFVQNISKPPFVETLVFKVEQAEGASLQNLVLTNGLKASKSEPYFTGDTVRLNFTLTNRGKDTVRIHVGLEGTDPSGGFIAVGGPGWGSGGVELAPGTSFTWEGELNLTRKGIYKLYPVYLTEEGIKVDNIPAEPGATASLEIAVKRYSFLGLQLFSPAELRVYDSEGRVTGVINEKIKEEIPSSFCLPKQKVIVVLNPTDTYKYEVLGTGEGSYSLIVVKGQEDEVKTVSAQQMPISPGVVHQYSVDWEVLGRGEKGVTIQIDQDSDGVFESVVLAGDEVTGGEIGGKPAWWPLLVLILIVLALSLSIVVYQASRGKSLPGRSS
jgi:parallel beta-helix repeat protein